ncbi:hypothetical protein KBD33_01735 [Candidatus Gracilibacteria bacterium]|nr:hypothetical protein [Candidatus Gracilibacteria bacterium]
MNVHPTLHTQRGSALLVSLIVLILVTLMTTVFLERIWSFSQTSKGIETSNMAYYDALGVIETQLIYTGVTKYQPWNIQNLTQTTGSNTGKSLIVSTGSSIIPKVGEGNSSFDPNYNIITLGQPIQLVIPDNINWDDVNFIFRVPKIGTAGTGVHALATSTGYVLWTIGYTGASLFASGETEIFRGSDINHIANIGLFDGITNSGSMLTVNSFYNNATHPADYLGSAGSKCVGYACTLKLSLIRPVQLTDSGSIRTIPFLEYKIEFTQSLPAITIPSQYMILNSSAYSYGFYRSRTVRIPQITTNTALDFAILQ